MAWRKWLVRTVVFSVIAGAAGAAWLFQFWTSPEAVRGQVIQKLQEMFPGAVVTLDYARLRLMGGIFLNDLRLARRDDAERRDFAHFPRAVLFHDKELLAQGQLVIRKIELDRPRLRLVREHDGLWNLSGLIRTSPGQHLLPTVVIHAGTIILEDRQPNGNAPTVELSDVNLTLLNNPAAVVLVEANGKSDVAARIQFRATWQRQSNELTLSCSVQGAPLNAETLHRFGAYVPPALAKGLTVQGQVSGDAEMHVRLDGAGPLHYRFSADLAQGSVRHPLMPLELDQIQTRVDCEDGRVRVKNLTARSGPAKIEASGTTELPQPDKNFNVQLVIDRLPVNANLLNSLPKISQTIQTMFQPTGPATLRFECACRDGKYTNNHCFIFPKGMSACFHRFKYPIHQISGVLDYDLLREALKIDLRAHLAKQAEPFTIQGTWNGKGDETFADVLINGSGVRIDEQLVSALPEAYQAQARNFHPSGLVDFMVHVHRQPGRPFANHYQARFHHAELKWEGFKYALRDVRGLLDIFTDHWEFRDFEGTNGRGLVKLSGRSQPVELVAPPPGATMANHFQLLVAGANIDLNEELYNALQALPQKGLSTVWDTYQPTGRVNFWAAIDHVAGDEKKRLSEDIALKIDLQDGTAMPRYFRVPFKDVRGTFHYSKNRVQIWDLKAAHKGGSRFDLKYGTVDLQPGAGYYATLRGARAEPLVLDDELLEALPERPRKALQALHLKEQPLDAKTQVVIAQKGEPGQLPDVWWDGECSLKDVRLTLGLPIEVARGRVACQGRHDGKQFLGVAGNLAWEKAELLKQPFHDVRSNFKIHAKNPETVLLELRAPIFGGEVSGLGKVDIGPNLRYDLNLTASQVKLEEFAQHNLKDTAQWKGQAEARLHVSGRVGAADSLEGNGSLDMRTGKLYNLPFLLDLLKFLGFRWPDRTLFEEAHAVFAIQGKRVRINRLDLLGNVISFWGKGEVNSDGSDVQLDFYPTWGRLDQMLPPVVRNIPPTISKMLIKIEARGRLSSNPEDLRFRERLVPPLFEPIMQIGDRWGGADRGQ
jgi:hypothetical protein